MNVVRKLNGIDIVEKVVCKTKENRKDGNKAKQQRTNIPKENKDKTLLLQEQNEIINLKKTKYKGHLKKK